MTFISARYQLIDKFKDKEVFKNPKMRFHAVLAKKEEEILVITEDSQSFGYNQGSVILRIITELS